MRRPIRHCWLVLALGAWVSLAAGEFRCSLCGHLGDDGELSFDAKDQVEQKALTLCLKCKEIRPLCFLCTLPIPEGAVDLSDGRFECPRDAQNAVANIDELRRIAEEARVAVDRTLSRFMTLPSTALPVAFEDGPRLTAAAGAGAARECAYPMCRLNSARSPDGAWRHSAGFLTGQPRSWLALEVAHILAHAWLAENKPEGRKLAGGTTEAFCDLVAWRAAEELGLVGERGRLEASRLVEDQLTLLLEADRTYDFTALLDWVRFGDGPRLVAGEVDQVRRINESLRPAPAQERQVIPPSPGQAAAPSRLALNGILGSGQRRLALINETTLGIGEKGRVRLGDGVLEVQCLEIRSNSVMIQIVATGEKMELNLKR